MTINSLSPGFVKIRYARGAVSHTQTLPVIPALTPVVDEPPTFLTKGGGSVGMSAAIDGFMAVFKPLFFSDVDFASAEFWSQPTPTDDPIWIYNYPIALSGTGTGSSAIAGQGTLTLRTSGGGIAKLMAMECITSLLTVPVSSFPFPVGSIATLAAYMTHLTNAWIVGRDGYFPAVPIKFTTKTNDALRRKIYLFG